jgi:metal-sulfur cluster biosynthetic enzyme
MPECGADLERAVLERLNGIQDPCSVAAGTSMGLTEMGLVEAVTVSADGDVRISLRLTSPTCNMLGFMAEEAHERVRGLPGVRSVDVVADQGLDWSPSMMAPAAQQRRRERLIALQARPLRRSAASRS